MQFLVAIDGSEPAERALRHALRLAGEADADVTVVHSVQPDVYEETSPEPVSDLPEEDRLFIVDDIEDAENRGERYLEDAAELAANRGVDAETELLYGDPVETVADYAADGGFDGVFVGHRGLSERAEALLGSVAKELVARSSVPVTVVR